MREILLLGAGLMAAAGILTILLHQAEPLSPKVDHLLLHYHLAAQKCTSSAPIERRDHWCRKEEQKRQELAALGITAR